MTAQAPKSIIVLFDESCAFCLRVIAWLHQEETWIPIETLPMREAVLTEKFRQLAPLVESGRFLVLTCDGKVYLDTKARVMILYALKKYRDLSLALSSPGLYSLVDFVFQNISRGRHLLTSLMDSRITHQLRRELCEESACGTCEKSGSPK